MTYKLNDNVENSFKFQIDDCVYDMAYPTLDEIEKEQEKISKLKESEQAQAITDWMYSFITKQGDAPEIKELLKKQNIKVISKFNEMLNEEFKEFLGGVDV